MIHCKLKNIFFSLKTNEVSRSLPQESCFLSWFLFAATYRSLLFCCCKTVVHYFAVFSDWVRYRSHGVLHKIRWILRRSLRMTDIYFFCRVSPNLHFVKYRHCEKCVSILWQSLKKQFYNYIQTSLVYLH